MFQTALIDIQLLPSLVQSDKRRIRVNETSRRQALESFISAQFNGIAASQAGVGLIMGPYGASAFTENIKQC